MEAMEMEDPGDEFENPPALWGVPPALLPPMLLLRPLDDRVDSGVDDAENDDDAEDGAGDGDGPPWALLPFLNLLMLLPAPLPPLPPEPCFLRLDVLTSTSECALQLELAGVVGSVTTVTLRAELEFGSAAVLALVW